MSRYRALGLTYRSAHRIQLITESPRAWYATHVDRHAAWYATYVDRHAAIKFQRIHGNNSSHIDFTILVNCEFL